MRQRQGFSLVELSVVLVILGLLVGGILAGQSLIRSAEMRSTIQQTQRYVTAYYQFRDKYDAIPGDMATAQNYWGQAAACPGDVTHPSTDARTCNGDGNGALDNDTLMEKTRIWHHLADAGLIEGTYTGVTGGSGNNYSMVPGVNVPRGKAANVGFSTYYWASMSGDPNWPDGIYRNFMFIGGMQGGDLTYGATFSAGEVSEIDTKMDDGKPAFGKIRTAWNNTNCVSAVRTPSATYAVGTGSGKNCSYLALF